MNGFLKKSVLVILSICCFIACEPTTNNNTSTNPADIVETSTDTASIASKPSRPVQKECDIQGKILEGNRKLMKEQNRLVCIVADESTKDEKLGDSHRILEIYNTETCELIKKETLPVNISADFPYLIADIIYNKTSHLIAIKGHGSIYCYDVENEKLLDALIPDFLNERIAADAQSGKIQHLEVWENYLLGYASDIGAFVFDLTDTNNPKTQLPAAEYDLSFGEGEDFSSLFFLHSGNKSNTYQAILPTYDYDERKFNINPLFDNPKNVNTNISKNVKDNRFIVLKTKQEGSIAIDMETQKNVALPKNLKEQSAQEILNWLKKE